MKKLNKIMSCLLITGVLSTGMLFASGCSVNIVTEEKPEKENATIINPSENHDTYTSKEQVFILSGIIKNSSYKSDVIGNVICNVPEYSFELIEETKKNSESAIKASLFKGDLVSYAMSSYFYNDKVVLSSSPEIAECNLIERLNYVENFGKTPFSFSHFILDNESVISAESLKENDDLYTLTFKLDEEKSTENLEKALKNFYSTDEDIVFNNIVLTASFKGNWQPVSLYTTCSYQFNNLGANFVYNVDIVENFKDFEKESEIIDENQLKERANGELTENVNFKREISGGELLFNSLLSLDLKNGINVSGVLKGNANGTALSMPIEGCVSFDLNKYLEDGINSSVNGYFSGDFMGVPVEIFYTGDSYLYVNVATTRYKYFVGKAQDENAETMDLGGISSLLQLVENENMGETRHFTLKINDGFFAIAQQLVSAIVGNLPEDAGIIKDLALNRFDLDIFVGKGENRNVIDEAKLNIDLNIVNANLKVTLNETLVKMPVPEDLSSYVEENFDNVNKSIQFFSDLNNGISNYNLSSGIEFSLNVGARTEGTTGPFVMTLPGKLQVNEQGPRLNIHLGLGGLMPGMFIPDEILYENGKLYMLSVLNKDGRTYTKDVQEIDLLKELSSLIPSLKDANLNISRDQIIEELAKVLFNSTVESETLEDGTIRDQLYLSDNIVKVVAEGYKKLIAKGKTTPAGFILGFFDFPVEEVILRSEYKDNVLTSFSLRLFNEKTAPFAGGKDCSFIIEMENGKEISPVIMDRTFALIESGKKAMAESSEARTLIDEIAVKGFKHIGKDEVEICNKAQALYDNLSFEGQVTVTKYNDFVKNKNDLVNRITKADQFTKALTDVLVLENEQGKEQEIKDLFVNTLNPIYKSFDARQKEYVGEFAVNQYIIRAEIIERDYLTAELIAGINNLTTENFPKYVDFKRAIDDANKKYNSLSEENKQLITNYNKIAEAQKELRVLELKELDVTLTGIVEDINALSESTKYNSLKSLKDTYNSKTYVIKKVKEEEKHLVPSITAFNDAGTKMYNFIKERYDAIYAQLEGFKAPIEGDEYFNLITDAKNYYSILDNATKSQYKQKSNQVGIWGKKHQELETADLIEALNNLGTISFDEESYNKIVNCRNLINALRDKYVSAVYQKHLLVEAEVEYARLSLKGLFKENVTESDRETVINARKVYNEAISAYNNFAVKADVKSKLAQVNAELCDMESALNIQ